MTPQLPKTRFMALMLTACCAGVVFDAAATHGLPALAASASAESPLGHTLSQVVVPLFSRRCIKYHNPETLRGGVNLQRLTRLSIDSTLGDCRIFPAAARKVQAGGMRPQGRPAPPQEQIFSVVQWIYSVCSDANEVQSAVAPHGLIALVDPSFLPVLSAPDSRSEPSGEDVFGNVMKPMIRKSCGNCHNPMQMRGGLDLTRILKMSPDEALKDRDLWQMIARRVESREMPAAPAPQLTPHERVIIPAWIRKSYADIDQATAPDPGTVVAHRLNRNEYNNTVRDLLGVNLNAYADFPPPSPLPPPQARTGKNYSLITNQSAGCGGPQMNPCTG